MLSIQPATLVRDEETMNPGRQKLAGILRTCHTPNTADIVAHIIHRVDNLDDALDILAETLPQYLAQRLGGHGAIGRQTDGELRVSRAPLVTPKRAPGTPRIAVAGAVYCRLMAVRETAEDGSKRWLRDMTARDLWHAVEIRQRLAAGNAAAAARYAELARAVECAGEGATVADVDPEIVVEAMTR